MELIAKEAIIIRHEDYYLSLRALAAYSSLSERKLRQLLQKDSNPLPCYRADGKILVKRSEFDSWLRGETRRKSQALDLMVDEVMKNLQGR